MTVEPLIREIDEPRVDIDPFARYNFIERTSKERWEPLLQEFARAKDEAEWLSVLSDKTDRKAAIVHLTHESMERWAERIGEYDLHYRPIRYTERYDGFAHEQHTTSKKDPNRLVYSVVAENSDIADKMEEAENEFDGVERHDKVGELLGFPSCCRTHFMENWLAKVGQRLTDPMYEAACNTPSAVENPDREHILLEDPNPYANPLWRYFGWSFVTHQPCQFECEGSVEIGKARREIMEERGFEEAAQAGYEWLNSPSVWTAGKGWGMHRNIHLTSEFETSSFWKTKEVTWRADPDPSC